mgnify:CR=1 FL=1|tara:strand:+ start:71986 stop:72441 length:456 start_codon:yes stop_codon:yes gene_type:complete
MQTVYFPSKYIIQQIKEGDFTKFREVVLKYKYKHVDFSFKGINSAMAESIGEAIQQTPIESISLAFNYLGSNGAQQFLNAIKKTGVTKVNLTRNFICAPGALELLKHATNSNIKHLILAKNKIGPEGKGRQLQAIARPSFTLDLSHNNLWQ